MEHNKPMHVSLTAKTWTMIEKVRVAVQTDSGLEKLSNANLVRLAMIALGEKHNVKGVNPDKLEPFSV
jgi:hypothetical protein